MPAKRVILGLSRDSAQISEPFKYILRCFEQRRRREGRPMLAEERARSRGGASR